MKQLCWKYYETPLECQKGSPNCDACTIRSDNTPNYDFLNDKYVDENNKVCTINGLLMAQAICARSLMEHHSESVLKVMGRIADAIEQIKIGEGETK